MIIGPDNNIIIFKIVENVVKVKRKDYHTRKFAIWVGLGGKLIITVQQTCLT